MGAVVCCQYNGVGKILELCLESRTKYPYGCPTMSVREMPKLPSPFSSIPFKRLSYSYPSPIHRLPGLTQQCKQQTRSDGFNLWTKREDQAGPLACYGNKYRKFEYIIPDIIDQGRRSGREVTMLVTEGAIQSNHTVQVAGLARVLGLKCTVLLHRGVGGMRAAQDKEQYCTVGNVHLNKLLGANVIMTDESDTGDEKGPLLPTLDELESQGEVPYWISSGASLHPLGGLGYARCAFEIARQQDELAEDGQLNGSGRFDYIFVACGSGSTLAGLIAGFKLLEKSTAADSVAAIPRIIGIMTSPTKSRSYQEERILRLARNTGKLVGLRAEDITDKDVHLDDRFAGEAYGILDKDTAEILNLASRTDAFILDPVYTAKVMRGMLHWAQGDRVPSEYGVSREDQGHVNALFIHTGGQSALSAYPEA